jgi:hypothetical protein
MKSAVVKPDAFAAAIDGILQEIGEETETKFFAAIDEAADKCNEAAQEPLTRGHGVLSGEYRSHFAIEKETAQHRHIATWHVEAPEYRLTHLLENGHVTRDGTKRTKKIKHISKGREAAEKVLEERLNNLWG